MGVWFRYSCIGCWWRPGCVARLHRRGTPATTVHYKSGRVTAEHFARELLIAAIAVGGITMFWQDVHRCAMYEGILNRPA